MLHLIFYKLLLNFLEMKVNKHHERIDTTSSSNSTKNTFNISSERELIKEELNSLIKNIDSIIKERFLPKEYYPNPST